MADAKADVIIGNIMSKTMEVIVLLCFVLVQPQLEYFVTSGSDIFKEV